jgi:tetratricopeptide (TPR) repeat protein
VEKDFPNDTIGHLAKFKNAKLSFYIGEFGWAKSQLDVLRAATSKLIANDAMYLYLLIADNEEDIDDEDEDDEMDAEDTTYNFLFQDENRNIPLKLFAKADFLIFKNQNDQAVAVLDSILMIDPYGKLADDVYFQKAKLQIKKGDYLGAEKNLKVITEKYAYDLLADDAFFYLGELYQYHFKDIQSAMKYYQTLMRDYPGSIYVVEARKRYRELRGDDVYVE